MSTPVMCNYAEAVLREEKHLAVPSVGAQRPAMGERYDRAFAPVFVVDFRTVFCCDPAHKIFPLIVVSATIRLLEPSTTKPFAMR
jgi:hypothetical protein